MTHDGLVTVRSGYPVLETIDRLARLVADARLHVFSRIDHGANAAEVGLQLRPTELLVFGNPRGGTPLMQNTQTAGIDLPIKALAWEDKDGVVWVTTNDADWLAGRHGLGERSRATIEAIGAGQEQLVLAATT